MLDQRGRLSLGLTIPQAVLVMASYMFFDAVSVHLETDDALSSCFPNGKMRRQGVGHSHVTC
jgi:hypothetical protein